MARIAWKDLWELLENPRTVVLMLALPAMLPMLVGQLRTGEPSFRILLANAPPTDAPPAQRQAFDALAALLAEAASFDVTMSTDPLTDPLSELRRGHYDVAVRYAVSHPSGSELFTAETDPFRVAALQQAVSRFFAAAAKLAPGPGRPQGDPMAAMVELGALPAKQLHLYYPAAAMRPLALVPESIALVLCYLPFLLASQALVRERVASTLDVLLAETESPAVTTLAGKLVPPVLMTLFSFGAMLLLAQLFYAIHVKPGILLVVLFVTPAAVASAAAGLAVSALASSTTQASMASGVFFLALTLLGGFLYPITAGNWVTVVSMTLPLSQLHPIVKAWMFGAELPVGAGRALGVLTTQALGCGLLAFLAWRRLLRRL